jgi:phenylacetate-coenzyme A ligase PaaK-like adenylate-forming protein
MISMKNTFQNQVFNVADDDNFNDAAIDLFRYQYENNHVYSKFTDHLKINPEKVKLIHQIPFLPIDFFKSQKIISGGYSPSGYFQSSGTTLTNTSRHYFGNTEMYEQSFKRSFEAVYGEVTEYCILALLPSYLEQKNSSLIFMVKKLVELSNHADSGFYLYNYDQLQKKILSLEAAGQKTLLIGVTFALLDLIDQYRFRLNNTIVMETGGMKGRKKEMVREELHDALCKGFGVDKIHSEYGMTELFSQAWSTGDGIFESPPWMKILIRDVNDPLSYLENGKTGGINVVDLANTGSCCFIATQDLGRSVEAGLFEVLGRFDHADIRGCNLLIT